jgi:hypothetical protein
MSINCTPRLIDMDVVGVTCMLFTVFVAWFSRIVSGALSPEDGLALLSSERCMAALSEGFRKIMAAQNELVMAFKSYHEDKLDLLMSSDKPKGSTPVAPKGVSSTQPKGGQPVTPSPSKKETYCRQAFFARVLGRAQCNSKSCKNKRRHVGAQSKFTLGQFTKIVNGLNLTTVIEAQCYAAYNNDKTLRG